MTKFQQQVCDALIEALQPDSASSRLQAESVANRLAPRVADAIHRAAYEEGSGGDRTDEVALEALRGWER